MMRGARKANMAPGGDTILGGDDWRSGPVSPDISGTVGLPTSAVYPPSPAM